MTVIQNQINDFSLDTFSLGVNYWPRKKAMYWWSNFDQSEVVEEFGIIKDIGLDLIRIFLLWDDWQPSAKTISQDCLRNLEKVCDIASDYELSLDVTFFIGHMSGPSWVPSWMLHKDQPMPEDINQVISQGRVENCEYANPFVDSRVIQAEELFISEVVTNFIDHPAIKLWNLGNEPDLFAKPSNASIGSAWTNHMVDYIRQIDKKHPITFGLHVPNLTEENGFRVNDIFSKVDIPAIHGYPMYADWADGPLDPDFVPFLCALTSALSGKATLMEEFGGPTQAPGIPSDTWEWKSYGKIKQQFVASEDEMANYVEAVLPRLVEVGALGAVIWCFADYSADLYYLPPCDEAIHERSFGLIRSDGSLKPHGIALRDFAKKRSKIKPFRHNISIKDHPDLYYKNPLQNTIELYHDFKLKMSE